MQFEIGDRVRIKEDTYAADVFSRLVGRVLVVRGSESSRIRPNDRWIKFEGDPCAGIYASDLVVAHSPCPMEARYEQI